MLAQDSCESLTSAADPQTLLPFNSLSSWAWHNDSLPADGENIDDYHGVPKLTHGRNVSYDDTDPNLPEATQWLIGNPNRINLGRIGLQYKNLTSLPASLVTDAVQTLDVWNGTITSTFRLDGTLVTVVTQGDFDSDTVAFQIDSDLIRSGDLRVFLDFPYPPIHTTAYKYEVFVGVYDFPLNHTTRLQRVCKERDTAAHIFHELQSTKYHVNLRWPASDPLRLFKDEPDGSAAVTAHRFTLCPRESKSASSSISFTAHFSPDRRLPDLPASIRRRNVAAWNEYWTEGGFVDITASTNPKADELQRRIVLSQYHMRVNSAATGQSPQESGLMNNGWYGKFHMEMLVWHHGQWSVWGRQQYFDSIFPQLYETFLPSSMARARAMGWDGARWPKMTEVNTGRNSPGSINALLMWQQVRLFDPHPMYLANLAYQADPTRETLQRWDRVITATANYMASYAWKNDTSGHYDLGPPAYGVTENTPPDQSLNLAYEVAYWRWGLDAACDWKRKLGQPVPDAWTTVAQNMAPPPVVDGLYADYEGLNGSWWYDAKLSKDPRSLVMLRGILPDTVAVDPEVARRTADKVHEVWTDEKIFGWGRPVLAINSARIGNPQRAIDHLTAYDYYQFDDAGFANRGSGKSFPRQLVTPYNSDTANKSSVEGTPPPFIAGNGAFLYSVAYLAAGWKGSTEHAPGFPKDGSWVVKHEGLRQVL
ncbi:hypothetical protein VTK73DRAFT_2465 [Phialemonium thermophilum]|uniref:Six-hairpin glycosidase-like protein n=1 Tax=Phialemonium thermophilum TaxID=223376 RepID=A0ABR3VS24_9PEZI